MRGFQPRSAAGAKEQRLADGGFVQGIKRAFGMDEERNAQIAAYRARAAAEKAQQQAQAQQQTPQPQQRAVTQYSGMSATQRREKELGLADGGYAEFVAGRAAVQPSPQDFIPAPDGGLDYGEITPEMGKAMRRQAGKIRLQHGVQNSNGTGWGLVHIEANHGKQISGLGFGSVQDFVAHVASSIQQVWQVPGNSQLLLTLKDGRKDVMYIQLEIAKEGDFYRVNSAFPVRQEDYESLKGMKKIWDGSEPTSAVTGQRPAFATAASASPESESSQGSSNARGQDASVPPAPATPQPITRADVTAAKQQAATIQTKETDKGVAMFSRTPATKAAYEARIDALFAGEKAAGPNQGARVLDRSDVLGLMGLGDGPVNLAEGKVIKGQTNHPRMTAEQWKKVPVWLDNPAAVFDSDTVPGALVLIAPETINGATVRMTVEPRKGGGADVHILSNTYDAPGFTPFARWFREGLGRLVDQKKFPAVLSDSGLQLSSST